MNGITNTIPTSISLSQNLESSVQGLDRSSGNSRIDDVAKDFESVFLSLLLKEMRNTLDPEDGGLFGSEGSDTLGGMFDMFMSEHLAGSQPLGIATAIKGYLSNAPSNISSNIDSDVSSDIDSDASSDILLNISSDDVSTLPSK